MIGRPEKYTVDWFSHDAHAGDSKTLSILFTCFGHKGIACWWLLLEAISVAKYHIIAIKNTEDEEFLASKMRLSVAEMQAIIQKIVNLGGINKESYQEGYIWSDNFIQRILPVYRKRKILLPTYKSAISAINNIPSPVVSATESIVDGDFPPHYSKVKKSKVKKRVIITYTPEEIKNTEWYKSFLKEYPAFNDKEFSTAIVWLEDHPGRNLNKSFLINWAKRMKKEDNIDTW